MRDGAKKPRDNDCGCLTHDGPHFLHMDEYTRQANRKLLHWAQDGGAMAEVYLYRFCELELIRLREKRLWMEQRQGGTQ